MKKINIWWILLLALIVRVVGLSQSFWWDELINVVYARDNSFWFFVTKYPIGDFHPQGYFALLWVWGRVFGFSEISLRLPSVLASIATVYLTYKIGESLFSKKVGLLASFFLALSPLGVFYAQEARMYAVAAAAVTFSFYCLICLIKKGGVWRWIYPISVALVLYSDYVAYLSFAGQVVYVIFNRERFKAVLLGMLGGIVLFIPGLILLPMQLRNGLMTAELVAGWKEVVGGVSYKNLILMPIKMVVGRVSLSNNLVGQFLFLGACVVYFLSLVRSINKKSLGDSLVMWSWLVLPLLIGVVISFWIPIFSYFRFIFILSAFYLLVAAGAMNWPKRVTFSLVTVVAVIEVYFLGSYLLNSGYQREDWRGAVAYLNQTAGSGDIVLTESNEIITPFRYYPVDFNMSNGLINAPAASLNDVISVGELGGYQRVYLVEYLVDVYDPNRYLEQSLKSNGFSESGAYDIRGVGLIREFELNATDGN